MALAQLESIAENVEQRFREGRRVLSFSQYLELFAGDPRRHGRDAARYVRDVFDHYGTATVRRPWGEVTRFRLFDAPWSDGDPAARAKEMTLVGQEEVQGEIYRVLSNFVHEGRPNRLILLHGPNGSAKSTLAGCILRALEHYSSLDEGALYRFHWVFPSRKALRGAIGFGEGRPEGAIQTSYALLGEEHIEARLTIELRDHPLFLLPLPARRRLLDDLYAAAGVNERPPEWLLRGTLSHKNQQVFEALLVANQGSLAEVLRHVQVERYFISRRYRLGAVTLGPEVSVDAGERQITADRNIAALPASLRSVALYEAYGELVDAAGGMIEFSDLLKRPIDAFRYLQLTLETGEIALPQQTVQCNTVMLGSANEVHLAAFREHHEFPSFRGRFELVRAPYLRSSVEERSIYDAQIVPSVGRHVAPHATRVAAEFAVLTRLRQPEAKRYADNVAPLVSALSALEKMDLYATGTAPSRLDGDAQKLLVANVGALYRESEAQVDFEGRSGVSPRETRTLLLDAAQSVEYPCLSPFAVLFEIEELCKRTSEFDWLREKPLAGGYHDHRQFRELVRSRLLDVIEEEMRTASGLVDEGQYVELFERYLGNVGNWVKGEKVKNAVTGAMEEPDERMMREVEAFFGVTAAHADFRRGLIGAAASWAIEHPDEKIAAATVFHREIKKLREAVFSERRRAVALLVRDLVGVLRDGRRAAGGPRETDGLVEERRRNALAALERLKGMGYCESCALDAGAALLRARFGDLT